MPADAFVPAPNVSSGVLALKRFRTKLDCDEVLFQRVVKQAFAMRRKTLRNALRPLFVGNFESLPYLDLRAEALGVNDFLSLCQAIKEHPALRYSKALD